MQDQTGIKKGFIDTPDTGITTVGGTIITATNDIPLKSIAITHMKSIAITAIKNMVITQALETEIKIKSTADTHTALKVIPSESISN